MSGIVLPPSFPLVGLAVSSTIILHVYQFEKVASARKKAGVAYPNLYASDAEAKADPKKLIFNCCQRAHANTLETVPFVLCSLFFVGFFYPAFASSCTLFWVIGRYGYTIGYASGDAKKRNNALSRLQYLGLAGLFFGTMGISALKTYLTFF